MTITYVKTSTGVHRLKTDLTAADLVETLSSEGFNGSAAPLPGVFLETDEGVQIPFHDVKEIYSKTT